MSLSPLEWMSGRVFNLVHRNNLVYNTCWEDPRLDRVALEMTPRDSVLVITSAGCNALDYALTGVGDVYAVDMNPRQNALLELKMAGIRRLDFEDFFAMFGDGRHPHIERLYQSPLREELSPRAKAFWDRRIKFFSNSKRPFYYRGTSGSFARMIKFYIDRVARVRPQINALLEAKSIDEQRQIFDEQLRERFWSRPLKFAMNRDTTLSLVGVPRAQRRQVERHYEGGIVQFVYDCLEAVFARLPICDNYFWRVYVTGSYTRECCPEYLKPHNFQRLKEGLVDNVTTHTDSVQGFLERHDGQISRFVLLDHMDWLCDRYYPLLEAEWQAIVRSATRDARVIWRSGGLRTDFVDEAQVMVDGQLRRVGELLTYHHDLATELHERDRVHTYGSFYITELAV